MIKSLTVIGPFSSEYSLARVNRALAGALSKKFPDIQIKVWDNYEIAEGQLNTAAAYKYPFLKELLPVALTAGTSAKDTEPEVILFNNFPKDPTALYGLKNIPGKIKLAYLAWEDKNIDNSFLYWLA